jgi:hypothetical protein
MAEARVRLAWDQTSLLWATFVNLAPFRKGRPVRPQDVHPCPAPAAPGGAFNGKADAKMSLKELRDLAGG